MRGLNNNRRGGVSPPEIEVKEKTINSKGVTLIELIVAIAIGAVITGTVVLMLNNGLTSWGFGSDRLVVQSAAEEIMTGMLEGDFKYGGIRDAVEVVSASARSITIVPLYIDGSHTVSASQNEYTLEKQYLAGSPVPVVKIKEIGSKVFETVGSTFVYGTGDDPDEPDDKIILDRSYESGSQLKILFYPDATYDTSVRMTFWWEPNEKTIYRQFKGKTVDLLARKDGVEAEDVVFTYLDNLNRKIGSGPGSRKLGSTELMRISGVDIFFKVRRKEDAWEMVSFVGIKRRSNQITGVVIREGSEVDIANSEDIGVLALSNITGASDGDVIIFEAVPSAGSSWQIKLEFEVTNDILKVYSYTIESPAGQQVATDVLDHIMGQGKEFNFLGFTGDGRFDYDDDENVDDEVVLEGDRVTLKVTRMDFDGAYLTVWP